MTRRQLANAAKAEASGRFAPAYGVGRKSYVAERLDSEAAKLRTAGSVALRKRCTEAQTEHFKALRD